ncbi:hypothetical protein DFH06DRAFT_1106253, partial [Mycena polygramma]
LTTYSGFRRSTHRSGFELLRCTIAYANPDSSPPIYPDLNDSAEALHIAVKKLRTSGVPLLRWVPFVHYGL